MKKRAEIQYTPKDESGYMLITVILIIAIIAVLGVSIISVTSQSVNTSAIEHDDQSAFYIAESGLNIGMEYLNEKILDIYNNTDNQVSFFEKFNDFIIEEKRHEGDKAFFIDKSFKFETAKGKEPKFDLNVERINDGNPSTYKITSIGTNDKMHNDVERKLERDFSVEWQSRETGGIPEIALLAKNKIELTNGSIDGDIGILNGESNSVLVNNNILDTSDTIYAPFDSSNNLVSKPDWVKIPQIEERDISNEFPELPPFPEIPRNYTIPSDKVVKKNSNQTYVIKDSELLVNNWITANYTLSLEENMQFKSIRLNENNNLYIDSGNRHKEIVVETLDITNGHINLVEDSKLTIYVTEKVIFGAGSTFNNNGKVKNLNIFLKGDHELKLAGSQKVFGSLYSENGDINLGAGAGIKGNIFTGGNKVEVTGGAWTTSPLILAPNARLSHTNGTIKGTVIVNSYYMAGGARLIQEELEFTEGPISSEGISGDQSSGEVLLNLKPIYEIE